MERERQSRQDAIDESVRRRNPRERRIQFGRAYDNAYALVKERKSAGSRPNIDALEGDVIGVLLYFRRLGITPSEYKFKFEESEDNSHLRVKVTRENHEGFSLYLSVTREGRGQVLQDIMNGTLKSYRKPNPPLRVGEDEIEKVIDETTLSPRTPSE